MVIPTSKPIPSFAVFSTAAVSYTHLDKGAGYNGIYDDSIYIKGRLLKADRDAKYEVVSYNGEDYLIGTSGKLAKGKKNLKNGDDKYFSTNKQGIVTYEGYEKE